MYPTGLPWAYGLTSGAVALIANVSIYTALAYLLPQSQEEEQRVNALFRLTENREVSPQIEAPLMAYAQERP